MKQAVLVVSFGSSYLQTVSSNIAAIEAVIAQTLPDYTLRRAFTSEIIRRKLDKRDGLKIDNVPQALEKLAEEGFERVILQPTHVISGVEYSKLCAQTEPFREKLQLTVGTPLLTSVEDYRNVIRAIQASVPAPAEDEALIFMGHGTAHFANATYALLDYMFHDYGWSRAYVGTVEGYPELEQVMMRLKKNPAIRRVRLHPLMVVAGDHANHDMAGDQPDSWRCQLEQAGYEVTCVLKGLGEYPEVRTLFADHALEAEANLQK